MAEEVPTRDEMIEALSAPSQARQIKVFLKYDDKTVYVKNPQRARILELSDDTMVRTQAIIHGKKPAEVAAPDHALPSKFSGAKSPKHQKLKSKA